MKDKIEVIATRYHPACWHRVEGRWKMTREYWEIWSEYQKRKISKATFYRKKAALKAAYDSEAGTSYIPPF